MTPASETPSLLLPRWSYLLLLPFLAIAILRISDGPFLGGDSLSYLIPIHNWMAGHGYTIDNAPHLVAPPGVGIVGYLFFLLVQDIAWSGALLSLSSYLLLMVVILAMHRHLTPQGAVGAAILVGLHPMLIEFVAVPLSELLAMLFIVLQFWAALACWRADAPWSRFLALGFTAGYGYLIRPELGAGGGVALLVVSVHRLLVARHLSFSRRLLSPLIGFLVILLLSAPYVAFLSQAEGKLTLTGKGVSTLRLVDARKKLHTPATSVKGKLTLVEYYKKLDPALLKERLALGFYRERVQLFALTLPALLLLAVSLAFFLWKALLRRAPHPDPRPVSQVLKQPLPLLFVALPLLMPLLVLPFINVFSRHLIPYALVLIVLFCGLAGWLMQYASAEWSEQGRRRLLTGGAVLALILVGGIFQKEYAPVLTPLSEPHPDVRSAAEWMFENRHRIPVERTATSHRAGVFSFYALGRSPSFTYGPALDWAAPLFELHASMRSMGVEYVVLTASGVYLKPNLKPLWESRAEIESLGFQEVYTDPGGLFRVLTVVSSP